MTYVRHFVTLRDDVSVIIELKKAKFFSNAINYLGCLTLPGQLAVSQYTSGSILDFKPPTNTTELRSLPGFFNLFRRFVPNSA